MAKVTHPIELTNYEAWQLEKYGNIIPPIESTPDGDLFESGIEELTRMAEWVEMQAEQQIAKCEAGNY